MKRGRRGGEVLIAWRRWSASPMRAQRRGGEGHRGLQGNNGLHGGEEAGMKAPFRAGVFRDVVSPCRRLPA